MDLNPELTTVFGSGGLSLSPRAGARATFYDRSATSVEPTERKFFYTGADINARVSRVYGSDSGAGIGRIRHSIEPTLSYTYIPHIDQGNIPVFDSVDTVAAQNLTTFSVINRLTAHYRASKDSPAFTTFDIMVFKLSQSYDLNVKEDIPGAARKRSPIQGDLYVTAPRVPTLSASAAYDTYTKVVSTYSSGVSYAAGIYSLNFSELYFRDPATRFLIGGGTLKLGRWNLGGQWTRDEHNNKTQQEDYSLHYASQCWGIKWTYTVAPGEYRYMVMLDLKGIGAQGLRQVTAHGGTNDRRNYRSHHCILGGRGGENRIGPRGRAPCRLRKYRGRGPLPVLLGREDPGRAGGPAYLQEQAAASGPDHREGEVAPLLCRARNHRPAGHRRFGGVSQLDEGRNEGMNLISDCGFRSAELNSR